MTKIKNRNNQVKPQRTASASRKRQRRNRMCNNTSSRIYEQFVRNVLRVKKTPNNSQVDVVENEPLNTSEDLKTPKRPRRYFSLQNRENIDANNTINLSEDENETNESITIVKNNPSPSTSKSDVIDVSENSVTDGNHTCSLIDELEIIEIENKSTEDSIVIDLSADDSTKNLSQDLDDIVILHANCTPQKDDIEILSHKKLPRKRCSRVLEAQASSSPKNPSPNSTHNEMSSPKSRRRQTEKISGDTLKLNVENNTTLDFIPLELNKNSQKNDNNNHFNKPMISVRRKIKNREINRKMKMVKRLGRNTLSPKSKLQAIGTNVYSDKPVTVPSSGLRPIIIDGSNVAYHHSNNKHFSCKGLEICINYFKQKGHKVTAFVPQYRVKMNKCDNPKLLSELVERGDVILTPSRIVDGRPIVSYDDRYIVQTAALKEGIIVTRDNYNDLLSENPAWWDTIKYRLLQFTWVDDFLMFPNDPLGSRGPNLERFLRF